MIERAIWISYLRCIEPLKFVYLFLPILNQSINVYLYIMVLWNYNILSWYLVLRDLRGTTLPGNKNYEIVSFLVFYKINVFVHKIFLCNFNFVMTHIATKTQFELQLLIETIAYQWPTNRVTYGPIPPTQSKIRAKQKNQLNRTVRKSWLRAYFSMSNTATCQFKIMLAFSVYVPKINK